MTRKEKKKNLHDNLNHSIKCLVHYKDDKETFEHYQAQIDYIVSEILGMVPEEGV